MKYLLSILILLGFMTLANASSYELTCPEGRWSGSGIQTFINTKEPDKFDDGIYLNEQIIRFNLPAQMGDTVELEYDGKVYQGFVTYFYDHTKYIADQSYIIILSYPFSLEERHVIQIDSGWTHFTYTKSSEGADGEVLVTTTLTAKCNLELSSY